MPRKVVTLVVVTAGVFIAVQAGAAWYFLRGEPGLCEMPRPNDIVFACRDMSPDERAKAHRFYGYPNPAPLSPEELRHAGDGIRQLDNHGREIQPHH